jgi:hypothetical protein
MAAALAEIPPFLRCSHCGDRIGVYEPAWLELADGTLRSSSFLNLPHDLPAGERAARLWHLGCLAPDAFPATARP